MAVPSLNARLTRLVSGLDRPFLLSDDWPQQANQDAIMHVGGWLRSLGLEEYEAAFRENKVDAAILPKLTAEDLRIWVSRLSEIAVSCLRQSSFCAPSRNLSRVV